MDVPAQVSPPRLRIVAVMRRKAMMLSNLWLHAQRYFLQVPGCVAVRVDAEGLDIEQVTRYEPHGILAHIQNSAMHDQLRALNVPIVNTSAIRDDMDVASVLPDNHAAGRMAAEHLISKGYRLFAYMGLLKHAYARDRCTGFADTVKAAGHSVDHIRRDPPQGNAIDRPSVDEQLVDWVQQLPPGTGLMVDDDRMGNALIAHLTMAGIDPRGRLAIVTGHDRESPSQWPLSGVKLPEDRWGYEAARLLVRIIRGEAQPRAVINLPPLGIVERESTSDVAFNDVNMVQALEFIRENANRTISVDDVAKAAMLSRRSLERRFRMMLGKSILEAIHDAHLGIARTLLIETDLSMYAVARESGMSDEKHLRRHFARAERLTPGEFRKRHRVT